MGNSLRCCLACVLPCGALDLIRIVHLSGHVEEITHPITAGEVLKNNPNHVLSKPSCSQGMVRRILILSPESELKRGSIYFLIPAPSVPEKKKRKKINSNNTSNKNASNKSVKSCDVVSANSTVAVNGRYVTVTEKKKSLSSSRRDRRSSKAEEWRPHLDSIFED